MKLIMFDIDGTLLDTFDYNGSIYPKMIKEIFGLNASEQNWSTFKHATDKGILSELIERNFNRSITEEEEFKVKDYVMSKFEELYMKDCNYFKEIRSGIDFFEKIKQEKEFCVSIATGGWRNSALLKLKKSGFDIDNVPLTTSDDAISREKIMKKAEEDSKKLFGIKSFEKIIYFGDGMWDVKATANVGYEFIGIGKQIDTLRKNGVKHTFSDYSDSSQIMKLLKSM